MRVKTKQRCCPECKSTEFEHADCQEGRESLGGYTTHCLECNWEGFTLQLIPIEGVKTAAEVAERINAELQEQE